MNNTQPHLTEQMIHDAQEKIQVTIQAEMERHALAKNIENELHIYTITELENILAALREKERKLHEQL